LVQRAPAEAITPGASVTLALRPENIALANEEAAAHGENRLRGRIIRKTYFGAVLAFHVDAGPAGQLIVHVPGRREGFGYEAGQTVWLHWPEDATVIVGSEDPQRDN